MDYDFLKKRVVGPIIRHYASITAIGQENVPLTGPVIFAVKHEAIIDTFTVAMLIERSIHSFAKEEYFTGEGWRGELMREFFTRSQAIPVYRTDLIKGQESIEAGLQVLHEGGALIIHPEGGRSIDGRVFRATLSFIDMAVETGAVIVPVGIIGTRQVNPIGDKRFHKGEVTVIFEKPVSVHVLPGKRLQLLQKRHIAKEIMTSIARVSHAPYVDTDLKVIKAELLAHDDA